MPTGRRSDRGQQRPTGNADGGGGPAADEKGAAAPLELVILAPLLMLLVVFVLWAGRSGRAVLVADLAAGEAAAAASVCCEDDPSAHAEREAVVRRVLKARPNLQFLCIGGIRPAELGSGGGFVDEAWLQRFEPEIPGRTSGVGMVGVRFECETDGAVAPLRGLFPTVSFYGQATEVVAIPPRLLISIGNNVSQQEGNIGDTNRLEFVITFSAPTTQDVMINYKKTGGTAGASDHGTALGSVPILKGHHTATTIAIPITGDNSIELDETLELELELVPSDPCASDVPALVDPVEKSVEIKIQCDDPTQTSTYEKPVDSNGVLKEGYWKTQVTGIIVDDD